MSRTQPQRMRQSHVSRALAADRLGIPAVLFFVLAGVAPLTVAAGVIPTAYQTTGRVCQVFGVTLFSVVTCVPR